MKTKSFNLSTVKWMIAVLTSVILTGSIASIAEAEALRLDPALVVGPKACGECHKASFESWKHTKHMSTFKKLPRKKSAKKIVKAMGLKRIKSGSDCLTCHFTSKQKKAKSKPIAGITCESCHGAGKNWETVHSDFGGKGVTAKTEAAAHKKQRYAASEKAGMIRPSSLYKVAQNCYGCHTVPNEKLVNIGGHVAGSDFELVAWTQGEVRHNVWYTKDNSEAAINRRRMMYIVGKALDLEFALRGVAKATTKAKYAVAMAKRAGRARKVMVKLAGELDVPELKAIATAASAAKLKLNNEAQLSAAAEQISGMAKKLATKYDGSDFGKIDSMLPASADYKGKPSE